MNNYLLIVLLIIATAITTIAIATPKIYIKTSISTVLGICIALCTICCAYLSVPSFKHMVDMKFNTTEQHRYIINNQSFYLPLPDKTILHYRTSDTDAVYITQASFAEISDFYFSVAENNLLLKSFEGEKLKLSFKYHNENFVITAGNDASMRKMTISID